MMQEGEVAEAWLAHCNPAVAANCCLWASAQQGAMR